MKITKCQNAPESSFDSERTRQTIGLCLYSFLSMMVFTFLVAS